MGIKIDEFMNNAITLLNNKKELKKIIEIVEINYLEECLKNLAEVRVIKRTIQKDATASFIQNLIRILGPKDEISLKYANLSNEEI